MKLSERWLRELANPDVDTGALARSLTMAGVMVDAVAPAAPPLDGVIVGRILSAERHPDADKLRVCIVDVGDGTARQIVCGAPNARKGLNAPVALPGVTLPGGITIEAATLRGVESGGMLCSGRELGLGDAHAGLLELPVDAKPGRALADLLGLPDNVFEFDITPNRGDCLSAIGIAREVAAVHGLPPARVALEPVKTAIDDVLPVTVEAAADCPVYCGRLVRGVDSGRASPLWLQERLRRAGIRPQGAAVDVTAYVMLELGQPLHAFDAAKLDGGVRVRRAAAGERLTLLGGQTVELDPDVLVIADAAGAVAMAGVMGGEHSAVGTGTHDVFLESAHFAPLAVAGRARRFGLHTDASLRFERGVDPSLPRIALERATMLLVDIAGGKPGPVTEAGSVAPPYAERAVPLRRERLATVLGVRLPDDAVEQALSRLQFRVKATGDGWEATAPAYRFDVAIEADLIEEVARIHGYDRIEPNDALSPATMLPASERRVSVERLADALVHRGYQQVVTYSFVDAALQRQLMGDAPALKLANPISADMAEMRTSLWPGLVDCLMYNAKRQQSRVRIFEHGLRFIPQPDVLSQEKVLAALAWGDRHPPQWGLGHAVTDFYDLKADCDALLAGRVEYEAAEHPALHPGQSARVVVDGIDAGWIGALHPKLVAAFDLQRPAFVFELSVDAVCARAVPAGRPVSRFPGLRRDLALVVPEAVTVGRLLAEVDAVAPDWLERRFVFDIYRGKGIEPGLKSVALGLILQETSRTLTDTEVDAFVQDLISHLGKRTDATLRD